jgi:glycosyltransferase involved in cell wall biosynthesis
MKTALIHYWLVNNRGGEKVLSELARLFPEADLFTHVYDAEKMPQEITRLSVRTTFINRLPFAKKLYQSYLPLMLLALHRLNLSEYDLIISCESGPAKGVRKPKGAVHICYCFTPMRYLWDMAGNYFQSASLLKKIGMKLLLPGLRKWDLWSATQVDHFIADSRFVAERIRRIYGREATVIYPPVDVARFSVLKRSPQDFYLLAGQLTAYKRADLAVEAFSRTGKRLVVAGAGDESGRLKASASKNVEFLGRVSDEKLNELYSTCRALIFPGIEDFGIVLVEAQAAGAPVIAFRAGGALETVRENETGTFFAEPSADSLIKAVERFEMRSFDAAVCRAHAQKFAAKRFETEFRAFCEKVIPGIRTTETDA